MMLSEKMGEAIKKARRGRGLTQVQMSEMIGCSQNYVALLEKGNFSLKRFDAVMDMLKCKCEISIELSEID